MMLKTKNEKGLTKVILILKGWLYIQNTNKQLNTASFFSHISIFIIPSLGVGVAEKNVYVKYINQIEV